jgi:hypothetical protein
MNEPNRQTGSYPAKPAKPSSVLLWIVAVFLLFYGSFFFIAFLGDLISGNYEGGKMDQIQKAQTLKDSTDTEKKAKDTSLGIILSMGFICGLLPLGLSGLSIYNIHRRKTRYTELLSEWLETCILKYAANHNGRVMTQEVAIEFSIGFTESKKQLDQLVIKSVADVLVTDSGEMIYGIRGMGDDKSEAERI